jgi:A/G-specific adenine glycosylase
VNGGSGSFAAAVVAWQRVHGRHGLPWQGTRDPYRVWLSEVMLQQTQVATVLRYYEPFLRRFPDVQALAAAEEGEVLARWSGLGYYARARSMHRCAMAVVAQHGGRFPGTAAALEALPGIGRSTAAAIAAFCFGERAAILDGNVKRVLARATGFRRDLALPAAERELWAAAEALLPDRAADIAAYTQGLMDLGATVCTARAPACPACPLLARCEAARAGDAAALPLKTRRITRRAIASALLWLEHGARLWLVQRPPRGVWAGLRCFPAFDDEADLAARVQDWPGRGERLESIVHVLTHRDWTLSPLRWRLPERTPAGVLREVADAMPEGGWFTREEALALGLPAPVRRWIERG